MCTGWSPTQMERSTIPSMFTTFQLAAHKCSTLIELTDFFQAISWNSLLIKLRPASVSTKRTTFNRALDVRPMVSFTQYECLQKKHATWRGLLSNCAIKICGLVSSRSELLGFVIMSFFSYKLVLVAMNVMLTLFVQGTVEESLCLS